MNKDSEPTIARADHEKPPETDARAGTALHGRLPDWLLHAVVEELPIYVILKDLDGRFTYVNRQICDLLERPAEEILGKSDVDFYPPEMARMYREDDLKVIKTGQPIEQVEENRSGLITRHVRVHKTQILNPEGDAIGVAVVFWDVTAHTTAEADLEQERFLFHMLLDSLPDFIYFKDRESRFLRVSRALAMRMGLSDPAEAVATDDFDYFPREYAQAAREDELRLMQSGQHILGREEYATWPDDSKTWVATSKLPLQNDHGETVGTFGISRDITELKQTAEALMLAKEAAESANRTKSEFVANLSHEIRTPMNAVIGMAELLLGSSLDVAQRDQVRTILESGEALLDLLNEILDFSRIESGHVELDPIPGDLRESIAGIMKSLAVRAHGKGLELAYDISPDVPRTLDADFSRLRQVLVNLVGNAIKFTLRGEVVLKVEVLSRTDDEVTLRFSVRDTGIGIPAEKLGVIFEEFEQVDKSTTRRFGGTGLGLAISLRIVRLMGGQIEVESEVERGSSFAFSVTFPIAENPPEDQTAVRPSSLAGIRVLLVDDNVTNLRILSDIVNSWGMAPVISTTVASALSELQQAIQTDDPFRLVITDVNMPESDGFDLAQSIREDVALRSTAIIMLTSGMRDDDAVRLSQLGVQAHMMKPVRQSTLRDAIATSLGGGSDAAGDGVPTPAFQPSSRSLRILVAEDSLVNQKLATYLLTGLGHTVTIAGNGRIAVERSANEVFDLILMDLEMPTMDGLEATGLIREREKSTSDHLPIIAMTAHALASDEQRCLDAGMDAYIAKPIRQEIVRRTLAELTERA